MEARLIDENAALKDRIAQLEATVAGMRDALKEAIPFVVGSAWCIGTRARCEKALSTPPTAYQSRVEELVRALKLISFDATSKFQDARTQVAAQALAEWERG
jgi:hypothetical protein